MFAVLSCSSLRSTCSRRLVSASVGLHPLVVMIALIVGGSVLGIWGMLLAIPVTAVLSVFGAQWLGLYRRSGAATKAVCALAWEWLGRTNYGVCLERQRARRDAVIRGAAHEVVWLVEHPRTITVDRRSHRALPPQALAELGIDFAKVERGLATWHGPGQLVATQSFP